MRTQPTADPARSLDAAWTWVGSVGIAGSVPLALYVRSGSMNLLGAPGPLAQDGARISAAYWGLLLTSLALAVLGAIAFRYRSSGFTGAGVPWPRFSLVEADSRDRWLARSSFFGLTIIPLATWFISLFAYSKSRIALWDSRSALAEGFFSSRWEAIRASCTNQPCFRMHPTTDAQQWFTFLNEFGVVLFVGGAFYFWLRWLRMRP